MLASLVSLMKKYCIVGSYGKTTTTSLIASIFPRRQNLTQQ